MTTLLSSPKGCYPRCQKETEKPTRRAGGGRSTGCIIASILTCSIAAIVFRNIRQATIDEALITSITAHNDVAALDALARGADANAVKSDGPTTLRAGLRALLARFAPHREPDIRRPSALLLLVGSEERARSGITRPPSRRANSVADQPRCQCQPT